MIWAGGRVVEDLRISADDRAFEHGLGLFETLRTWNGRALLLGRHLERMRASAKALGIPLDPDSLPDEGAVAELMDAEGRRGDALLRITLSGGLSPQGSSTLWMRAADLPAPADGLTLDPEGWPVLADDPLARHKTLNYWGRRLAFERARARGFGESLSRTPDGHVWEGSRTNLFLVMGDRIVTPPTTGPIVPGVMRSTVVGRARSLGFEVEERAIVAEDVANAAEVFLTNSVRGIVAVDRSGPATERLRAALNERLMCSQAPV